MQLLVWHLNVHMKTFKKSWSSDEKLIKNFKDKFWMFKNWVYNIKNRLFLLKNRVLIKIIFSSSKNWKSIL